MEIWEEIVKELIQFEAQCLNIILMSLLLGNHFNVFRSLDSEQHYVEDCECVVALYN